MQKELYKWLKDVEEYAAAQLISECSIELVYVDTLFEMLGDGTIELVDAQVGVPGKYYLRLQSDFEKEVLMRE